MTYKGGRTRSSGAEYIAGLYGTRVVKQLATSVGHLSPKIGAHTASATSGIILSLTPTNTLADLGTAPPPGPLAGRTVGSTQWPPTCKKALPRGSPEVMNRPSRSSMT